MAGGGAMDFDVAFSGMRSRPVCLGRAVSNTSV